ncbi:hypothetical protein PCANC_01243 [Puccinia coronata f. sp. avenae]|uniref:dolichyl-P-Glc:Man9GlcNAc2-PP-dolichol alpha-1,3-glucosyltransferase n=1 Tax=Puccinia coronata f. sp. avenae TaxID=200324 RepID=A0A2N5W3W4_9BASI|nr:hypothetical protein PCANC_01243 [Puccinia coronata f. sp. avenae]
MTSSPHLLASPDSSQQQRQRLGVEPTATATARKRKHYNSKQPTTTTTTTTTATTTTAAAKKTRTRRVSNHSTTSTILTAITSSDRHSNRPHQSIRTVESSPSSSYQLQQKLILTAYGAQSPIRKAVASFIKHGQSRSSIITYSILFVLLWKWAIGLGPYSGYRTPPLFGDLEAQRHWMAVTVQLQLKRWYSFDLEYWGLDYPPLTAYHSLVLGYVARMMDPAFVLLRPPSSHSNGWGDELHQQLVVFLRWTVLASELVVWIPAVLIYHFKTFNLHTTSLYPSSLHSSSSTPSRTRKLSDSSWLAAMYSALVVLLNPNLILIDNGHFQFNSIMLGLTLASVTCFHGGHDLLGAVMFVCSLSFKQMALYYSPAIFAYLFGKCLYLGHPRGTALFTRLALVSTGTTLLLFGPFIFNSDFPYQIMQVITRIFPIGRGLFEDKVGNFWCTLNLVIKIRTLASAKALANVALLFTLGAVLPVVLLLTILSWKLKLNLSLVSTPSVSSPKSHSLHTQDQSMMENPSPIPKTVGLLPLALYNSSIGFYLFSFQVHEKSILLPVLPLLLILSRHHRNRKRGQLVSSLDWDIICLISNVSVFREELGLQYLVSILSYNHLIGYNPLKLIRRPTRTLASISMMMIYLSMAGIHLAEQLLMPPSRLPDLFVVLNLSLSFMIFSASYIWSLLRMYEEAWTLVGFGALSPSPPQVGVRPPSLSISRPEQGETRIKKDELAGESQRSGVAEDDATAERSVMDGDEDEDDEDSVNVKLPTKRSSSLQQQRRQSKSSGSEGEELKSQSFGAVPRKIASGPLTKRMLKESGTGTRPSSRIMISSPSGEKLMNRIKNRLQLRSASPSSSSATSRRSSSLEDSRSSGPKGKDKDQQQEEPDVAREMAGREEASHNELEDPAAHVQNLGGMSSDREDARRTSREEEREERTRKQWERQTQKELTSPPLETAWELALRQSREEAIRRRREELLATRAPTNSSSKR